MQTLNPCNDWTMVLTPYTCCVEAAVASEDLVRLPEAAHGALWTEVNRVTAQAHEATATHGNVVDADSAFGFPKTTITVNVCLRPVRVMLMPTNMWWPAGST